MYICAQFKRILLRRCKDNVFTKRGICKFNVTLTSGHRSKIHVSSQWCWPLIFDDRTLFICELNWMFVPNLKEFPLGVYEISCSQEWNRSGYGQPKNIHILNHCTENWWYWARSYTLRGFAQWTQIKDKRPKQRGNKIRQTKHSKNNNTTVLHMQRQRPAVESRGKPDENWLILAVSCVCAVVVPTPCTCGTETTWLASVHSVLLINFGKPWTQMRRLQKNMWEWFLIFYIVTKRDPSSRSLMWTAAGSKASHSWFKDSLLLLFLFPRAIQLEISCTGDQSVKKNVSTTCMTIAFTLTSYTSTPVFWY